MPPIEAHDKTGGGVGIGRMKTPRGFVLARRFAGSDWYQPPVIDMKRTMREGFSVNS